MELVPGYPRKHDPFIRATENENTVTSEYLFRDGAGQAYKPADYLELFAQFVKDNVDQIEAIRILLAKPKGWGTAALAELRDKLTGATCFEPCCSGSPSPASFDTSGGSAW